MSRIRVAIKRFAQCCGGPRKEFATGGAGDLLPGLSVSMVSPTCFVVLISVFVSAAMDGAEIRYLIIRVCILSKELTVSIGFLGFATSGSSRLWRESCRHHVVREFQSSAARARSG